MTAASGVGGTANANAQLNSQGAFLNSDTDFKNELLNEALNLPDGSKAKRLAQKSDASNMSDRQAGLLLDAFNLETNGASEDIYAKTRAKQNAQAAADVLSNAGIYVPKQTVALKDGKQGVILGKTENGYTVKTSDGQIKNVTADNIQKAYADDMSVFKDYIPPEKYADIALKRDQNRMDAAATKEFTDKLGKMYGVNVAFDAMADSKEGFYTADDNTIHINDSMTKSDVIKSIAMHEITHSAEQSEDYAAFSDALINYAYKTEEELNQAIEDKISQYEKQGVYLTEEQALKELTAQSVRNILYSTEQEIDSFVKNSSPNVISRIYEAVKNVIRKIRAYFKGDDAALNRLADYKQLNALKNRFETILADNARNTPLKEQNGFDWNREAPEPVFSLNNQNKNSLNLNQYTQKEIENFSSSKRIQFANSETEIEKFINDNIVNRSPIPKVLYVGKIDNELANKIYNGTGVNIDNYNVILKSDFENSHADENYEQKRGQSAMTPQIISTFPQILTDYDNVSLSVNRENGKPVIIFEKDINGKKTIVEYVSDKHKTLKLQTMYGVDNGQKNNSPSTAESAPNASPITSETNSGTSYNNRLPDNSNDVNQTEQYSIKEELPYSDEEIIRSYRQTDNKKEQIKILSELNDCTQKKIKEVLARNGEIELPQKPPQKKKANKPQKAAPKTETEVREDNNKPETSGYEPYALKYAAEDYSNSHTNQERLNLFNAAAEYAQNRFGKDNIKVSVSDSTGAVRLAVQTGNGNVIIPAGEFEGNNYYPSEDIVNYKITFGEDGKAANSEQSVIESTPLEPKEWTKPAEAPSKEVPADRIFGEQTKSAEEENPSENSEQLAQRALEKGNSQIDIDSKREGASIKKQLTDTYEQFQLKFVDSSYTASKISPESKTYINAARSASKSADYNIGTDRGKNGAGHQTDIYGRGNKGKSLTDIFNPINAKGKEYASDFNNYMYQLLQSDRMSIEARYQIQEQYLNEQREVLKADKKAYEDYKKYLDGELSYNQLTGDALELAKAEKIAQIFFYFRFFFKTYKSPTRFPVNSFQRVLSPKSYKISFTLSVSTDFSSA